MRSDAHVFVIDSVNRRAARIFPLFGSKSSARQRQLEDAEFEIRPQHIKFDMLVNHLSQSKFAEWYIPGQSQIFDALATHPITDDDDLLATVNSHIKVKKLAGIAIECRSPALAKSKAAGNTMHQSIIISNANDGL